MSRTFHQTRMSLCPTCRRVLAGDYVEDAHGLYLEKHCVEHGHSKERVARHYHWLAGLAAYAPHTKPAKVRHTAIDRGCPFDCGECPQHRQQAAFFLFELGDRCDLDCKICLGNPNREGKVISKAAVEKGLENILEYAGPGQVLFVGGGEPTTHPELTDLLAAMRRSGFEEIWLYTNGRRIAKEPELAQAIAGLGVKIMLQWDSFSDETYLAMRGHPLLEEKQSALESLRRTGVSFGLCTTVASGLNDQELGRIFQMFMEDPAIGVLDIAPMAYVGKTQSRKPRTADRVTAQDILHIFDEQCEDTLGTADFAPISYAHPECLQTAYFVRKPKGGYASLKRVLPEEDFERLIIDRPILAPTPDVETMLKEILDKLWAEVTADDPEIREVMATFRHLIDSLYPSPPITNAERRKRGTELVKAVLIHSLMDVHNFDVGRAKMCISRTVLADGRLMPSCAFNVVHRCPT